MEAVCWSDTSVSTYSIRQCQNRSQNEHFQPWKLEYLQLTEDIFGYRDGISGSSDRGLPVQCTQGRREVGDGHVTYGLMWLTSAWLHLVSRHSNSVCAKNNASFKLVRIACTLAETWTKNSIARRELNTRASGFNRCTIRCWWYNVMCRLCKRFYIPWAEVFFRQSTTMFSWVHWLAFWASVQMALIPYTNVSNFYCWQQ